MINGEINLMMCRMGQLHGRSMQPCVLTIQKLIYITLRTALLTLLWLAQRLAETILHSVLNNFNLQVFCTKLALENAMISAMCPLLSVVVLGITLLRLASRASFQVTNTAITYIIKPDYILIKPRVDNGQRESNCIQHLSNDHIESYGLW